MEESDTETSELVLRLLKEMDIKSTPRKIYRLGKSEGSNVRPIKLVMNSEQEKLELMMRFKPIATQYERIFIRDDYSTEEREQIRRYVDEARKRNRDDESEYRWKVKGCPRKQLFLQKIKSARI